MFRGDGVSKGREIVQFTCVKYSKWVGRPACRYVLSAVRPRLSMPFVLTYRSSEPLVVSIIPQGCEGNATGTFGCTQQFSGILRLTRTCQAFHSP